MDEMTTIETQDISFGKEIAKTFVVSTAVTVGWTAGLLLVGFACSKYQEKKEAKKAKKNIQTEK